MNKTSQYLKTAKLIADKLNDSITIKDSKYLTHWINTSDENKKIYQEILDKNWYHDKKEATKEYNVEEGWSAIEGKLQKPTIKLHVWRYAVAVIVLGVFTAGYLLKDDILNNSIKETPIIVKTDETDTKVPTLTLEDGTLVELEAGSDYQTQTANSNGDQIIYNINSQSSKIAKYNYLTMPRGKQFYIKLSDGTQVWLNSESQLKYPVSFIEGETRTVELVYGEAYFDVSPSTLHKGTKFKVLNQSQEIEVLGTEFNIKAYKDESNIYTTLVEGKVSVNTKTQNQALKPSQQLNLNLINKTLQVNTVNVYHEISWKDGVFSFRRKPLVDIMKVLARWYDFEVVFVNDDIKKSGFNGVLGKEQKLEEILETIKRFGGINDYKIINKTVVLK